MKVRIDCTMAAFLSLVLSMSAQTPASNPSPSPASAPVPRLIRFSGIAKDTSGKPMTGVVGITFSLYKDQQGGAPLWMETQNVQPDSSGHYSVLLGSTKSTGVPAEMFASSEAQWLGVQPEGEAEQLRVLMVSVPYALKALDAETVGGMPPSAFVPANGNTMSTTASSSVARPTGTKTNNIAPQFVTSVGLTAPAADFNVAGSPVTGKGTLRLTWKVAPTSADTANAIVKRDASGNFSATTITATGQLVAQALSGNGAAIEASSPASNATVIYGGANSSTGATWGVEGETFSSDPGASGVMGRGRNGGVGVTGLNTAAGGIAVKGSNPAGFGFVTDSNVQQARTMGGWVKAMVLVDGFPPNVNILYCFNSTLSGAAATTPPCGFSLTRQNTGNYLIDFGFEVDDRFFSFTVTNSVSALGVTGFVCTNSNLGNCAGSITNNQAVVQTYGNNSESDASFYLIVY